MLVVRETEGEMEENWSDAELKAAVAAYFEMASKERAGIRFAKAHYFKQLASEFPRSAKAFEYRMQNISAVLAEDEHPWIAGFKPAKNVGTNVFPRLRLLIKQANHSQSGPQSASISSDNTPVKLNLDRAWELLRTLKNRKFERWTRSGLTRITFSIRRSDDGREEGYLVQTSTDRVPRRFDFAKFTPVWRRWEEGGRIPDDFRASSSDEKAYKLAYYLIPVLSYLTETSIAEAEQPRVGALMRGLQRRHIDKALIRIRSGDGEQFSESTKFDLVVGRERFPPKRVVGIALEELAGESFGPPSFKGGQFSLCFRVLNQLGYAIQDKKGNVVENVKPASDPFLIGLGEDIEQLVSSSRRGQGRGLTSDERKVVELAAMAAAKEELAKIGFTKIHDCSATRPYDFEASLQGTTWIIEVKGTTGTSADEILLTANERRHHEKFSPHNGLIVVTRISLDKKSLKASGGTPNAFLPWNLDQWTFEPTNYRAIRITGDE
jgi:hypothetical protein